MNNCYLFALPELLTEQNAASIEIKALAEWSDHVPDLYLILIGENPEIFPWAIYDDGHHPPAFVCNWDDAAARLDRLFGIVTDDPSELKMQLIHAKRVFAKQRNSLLVLSVSDLAESRYGRTYDKREYRSFMTGLVVRANTLSAELEAAAAIGNISDQHSTLRHLRDHSNREVGYWDAQVVDGYQLNGQEPEQLPEFLRELAASGQSGEFMFEFEPKLGAYQVGRHARKQSAQYGLVTAYGRWLLPLTDAQPLTNRYESHATRSWITLARPLSSKELNGEENQFVHALLDANGVEVLPFEYVSLHTVGDKLVYFRRLKDYIAGRHAYRIMRIDTGAELPGEFDDRLFSERNDGYIEAGLDDGNAGKHRGLLDRDGNRITAFEYEGFSEFHKKHKVAIAWRDGKCGLIDERGKTLLPFEYDRIAQKLRDGPPHFHGNATLAFTVQHDASGSAIHRSDRVGVVDKHGRVLCPPTFEPWHLQYAFDKEGRMLVSDDAGAMHYLHSDGTVHGLTDTREGLINEIKRSYQARNNAESAPSLRELAHQVDRGACHELIDILCGEEAEVAARVQRELVELLDRALADVDLENEMSASTGDAPAVPFFNELAHILRDERIWMHVDWKAVDEIPHAHAHLPHVEALASFAWDGIRHGEDIHDGFAAIDAHLATQGQRLIWFDTRGDDYIVGAVSTKSLERCLILATLLGVPLSTLGDGAG